MLGDGCSAVAADPGRSNRAPRGAAPGLHLGRAALAVHGSPRYLGRPRARGHDPRTPVQRPHANTPDAMVFIDDLIQDTRTDPLKRPHQLFLSGDQIYADDVATVLLEMLNPVGNELTGNFVVGDELTGGVEHLPTRWPLSS